MMNMDDETGEVPEGDDMNYYANLIKRAEKYKDTDIAINLILRRLNFYKTMFVNDTKIPMLKEGYIKGLEGKSGYSPAGFDSSFIMREVRSYGWMRVYEELLHNLEELVENKERKNVD